MSLAEAQRQYQVQLETVRTIFASDVFDDDDRDEALADLGKAKDALEVAWLEQEIGITTSSDPEGW